MSRIRFRGALSILVAAAFAAPVWAYSALADAGRVVFPEWGAPLAVGFLGPVVWFGLKGGYALVTGKVADTSSFRIRPERR